MVHTAEGPVCLLQNTWPIIRVRVAYNTCIIGFIGKSLVFWEPPPVFNIPGYISEVLAVCRSSGHAVENPWDSGSILVGKTVKEHTYKWWAEQYIGFKWYDTGQQHILTNATVRPPPTSYPR